MAFLDDHPDYKTYTSTAENHLHDVPSSVWSPLESLVIEAGGYRGEKLFGVVSQLAINVQFGYVEPSFAYQTVPDVVSRIRKNVNAGKFDLFMDCLSVLCVDGELDVDTLNDFLADHSIGYRLDYHPPFSSAHWEIVESEDVALDTDQGKIPSGLIYKIPSERSMKEETEMVNGKKSTKIFITHSSDDKEYVLLLTELLRNMKVESSNIVCTTDPIHRIPNGNNAFDWLKSQFTDNDLHMIFVLSENYFNSVPCLNEMGAAWLVAKRSDVLLLPSFGFSAWKKRGGCLSSDIQAGNMGSDDITIKAWLNDLKNVVIDEFGLNQLIELEWEKYRDEFIKKMKNVKISSEKTTDNSSNSTSKKYSGNPVVKAISEAGGEIKGTSALATVTGIAYPRIKKYINEAIENGEIERIGSPRNYSYRLKQKS